MRVRAVVFDFDGLILDTESTELAGWREVYRAFGCELTMEVWADAVGRPNSEFEPCTALEQLIGRGVDRESLWERKRKICRELNMKLEAHQGVREYLAEARRMGLKVGLASSSDREWVTGHLRRLGILREFGCLVCFEDTVTHKPEPGPYLRALEMLDVLPREAVALEDSAHGVAAAKEAGIYCVAVPNEVTRVMDLSGADLVIGSLLELPLGELVKRAATR